MCGQACVFYGAAEFSRYLDLLVLADTGNVANLRSALDALRAEVIAVPGFDERRLLRGHAVHFRCHSEEVAGLRVDVMASLRGVGGFILNYCRTKVSFGVVEAVNGNIRMLINRGRGYQNLRYLLLKAKRMAVTNVEFIAVHTIKKAA